MGFSRLQLAAALIGESVSFEFGFGSDSLLPLDTASEYGRCLFAMCWMSGHFSDQNHNWAFFRLALAFMS